MPTATSNVASREKLLSTYRILVHVLVVLVLIQAWMAGNSNVLFGSIDIELHGFVGNLSLLLGVAAVVLAGIARAPKSTLIVGAVVAVLLVAQVGLGYVGRETPGAAAWHIPNGVLIFGLAVYLISDAKALVKGSRAA